MHLIRSLALVALALLSITTFCPVKAQSYDPFDGHSSKFHVDLTRYFENRDAEAYKRNQLFSEADSFMADSLWQPALLHKKLTSYDQLLIKLKRHYEYYRLLNYRNSKDTIARQVKNNVEEKLDRLGNYLSQQLGRKEIRKIFADPNLERSLVPYKYFVDQINNSVGLKPSPQEQLLIEKLGKSTLAHLTDRYDRLMDDISAPDIILKDGTKLNPIFNRNALLQNKDPEVRKAATLAYRAAYGAHGEIMAATLIDIARQKNILSKLEGFKNATARNYIAALQLPESSVKSLLAEVASHAHLLKTYQQVLVGHAAKSTALDSVRSYDLSAADAYAYKPMPYAAVKDLIIGATVPLGKSYTEEFAWLLDPANGAMEIAGGTGSRVNEYTSIGYAGVPVSLYMRTYNGTLSSLLTLSHEGGHAIHQKLMNSQLLIPAYASGPNFLFEAFAMLNELLVLDKLQAGAKDIQGKAYYTQQFLNILSLEIFTAAEEGLFEQKLYDGVANGKIETKEDIDSLYAAVMGDYDLFFPKEPERKSEWINKRLFFDDPIYYVNYLYAMLVACKLYDQLNEEPKKFTSRYLALLKNGFDAPATVLLEKFMGFKLDNNALLKSTLRLMQGKTETLRLFYEQIDR